MSIEARIGPLRARQANLVAELDRVQIHIGDGARSMIEWVSARLDVTHDTARSLVDCAKVLPEHRDSESRLAAGELSFDRALATARLAVSGADQDLIDASAGFDVAGVQRLAARQRRVTRSQEHATFRDRFVAMQPSLDETSWRLWGMLPGVEGEIVSKALVARAEQLPSPVNGERVAGGRRKADALVSIAQDSFAASCESAGGANVTVFVDAAAAGGTAGEAGAEIASGPRVGPATLERLLCEGTVQVVAVDGLQPVAASPGSRAIRPAARRFVLWRDGACVIDGCRSRYRLQPHHVLPRVQGGTHDAGNLATLCWYHHHVAIHGSGFRLDPNSPPQRRRLLAPTGGPDPP